MIYDEKEFECLKCQKVLQIRNDPIHAGGPWLRIIVY